MNAKKNEQEARKKCTNKFEKGKQLNEGIDTVAHVFG